MSGRSITRNQPAQRENFHARIGFWALSAFSDLDRHRVHPFFGVGIVAIQSRREEMRAALPRKSRRRAAHGLTL
jgi:hypothetical protein